jgi:hypothetical protein
MPIDFTSSENDPTLTESEGSMFAPVPAWERGKKRRGFGMGGSSRVAPEPRSFASDDDIVAPRVGAMSGPAVGAERVEFVDTTDAALGDAAFAGTPIYANRTAARKGNGAAPIAIAAGVILLGGLAAAGWYASQPHDQGIAQLTPGATTTTTTATTAGDTVTPDAALPAQVAQNVTPAAPAAHAKIVTTTTRSTGPVVQHTTVARAAPARAPAQASDNAANASATATAAAPTPAPAPSAAPPAAAAPTAPLVLTIPPAAPSQAAPTTTAPVETPVTPQTTQAPPPTQTPPTT